MASFLQYKQKKTKTPATVVPIQETTVPDHLHHLADCWDHHSELSAETHEKISAATGGKSFTTFPLSNDNHHDIDADVAEHLTRHNYQVKDYAKGIATTKKMVGNPERGIPLREKHVEEKIGSVLEKTNASDDVKKSFQHDPARSATKSFTGGHHVVITHSPLGLAGMSTGTAWANQSCMNMQGGIYANRLQDDSRHGTHVAFLVHHDDKEAFENGTPSKPIARIAIKPYHEEEDEHDSDTIFRPETRYYGSGNTKFESAVSHWSQEKYPAKSGVEYTKNNDVYDDSNNSKYKAISKEDVEHSLENGHEIVKRGGAVDKSMIDHAIEHVQSKILKPETEGRVKENAMESLYDIGNLNTTHVSKLNKLAEEHKVSNWGLAGQHGDKFSSTALNSLIEKHGERIPNRALMNSKLPSAFVDKLSPNQYSSVRRSLIKPHHIDKVVDSYVNNESGSSYPLREFKDRLTKEHLDKIVKADTNEKRGASSQMTFTSTHPHFSQEHHDKYVAHSTTYGSTIENYSLIKNSKYSTVADAKKLHVSYGELGKNENLNSDVGKEIKDHLVKNAGLVNGKARNEISDFGWNTSLSNGISKHLTDDDYTKLAQSGKNIHFSNPEHSEKHLNAIHKIVKQADEKLDEHVDSTADEHGDSESDEKSEALKEKLDNHVHTYANAIEHHIENHMDDGDGFIKDYKHSAVAASHLENIEKLNHYATGMNSPHALHSDMDHYFTHLNDAHEKFSDLHEKTEERDNGDGEHNWH